MPASRRYRRAWWLLDLAFGGRDLTYSTEPLTVPSRLGEDVPYLQGLIGLSLELESETAQVQVTAEEDSFWGVQRRRYGPFAGRRFILRRWYEGEALEDTQVVLEGVVKAATFGSQGSPSTLALTLARALWEVSSQVPLPTMQISPATHNPTNLYANAPYTRAKWYPIVIGYPGADGSGDGGERATVPVAATPAYPVTAPSTINGTTWRHLIAGHRVAASAVVVWGTSGPFQSSVLHDVDDLGQEYAYLNLQVDATEGTANRILTGHEEIYVGWSSDVALGTGTGAGGGLVDEGRPVRGLGDLVLWGARHFLSGSSDHIGALGQVVGLPTTTRVDWARAEEHRDGLNRYQLDTVIPEPANFIEWLEAHVYDLFDLEEVHGPNGIYWRETPYIALRRDVRASLSTDPAEGGIIVERVGAISDSRDKVYNEISLAFGPHKMSTRLFEDMRIVGPGEFRLLSGGALTPIGSSTDTRQIPDARCKLSADIYGVRPLALQTVLTWSETCALAVLQNKVAKHALPALMVSYRAGSEAAGLAKYDVVELQDQRGGADFPAGTLAHVWSIVIEDEGTFLLELRVPWDVLRNPTQGV